jgi:hypothetical protein
MNILYSINEQQKLAYANPLPVNGYIVPRIEILEAIFRDGHVAGFLTSTVYAYTIDRSPVFVPSVCTRIRQINGTSNRRSMVSWLNDSQQNR